MIILYFVSIAAFTGLLGFVLQLIFGVLAVLVCFLIFGSNVLLAAFLFCFVSFYSIAASAIPFVLFVCLFVHVFTVPVQNTRVRCLLLF